MSLTTTDLLGEIAWIPRQRSTQLRRLGLETVGDLLTHYPRRHEDRREFAEFPREESEQPICLCGEVTKTRLNRFGRGKKIFEVTLQESDPHVLSEPLVCRWFNLHYVQKMILTGQRLVVFGKPRQRGQRICMEHPEFEVIENDDEISIHFRRITPIYPATEGLSQRVLRGLIFRLLDEWVDDGVQTLLPAELDPQLAPRALREIHFPPTNDALAGARETLVLAEFFAMQMLLSSRRAHSRARTGALHCGPGELLERFLRALPFDLTNAQVRVIEELRGDLRSNFPMNRLLQGDVGSGKTVVAIATMLLAVEAGFQAALMAPTQILAEQHYAVLRRWLEPLGVPISLRTGARKEDPLPLFANTPRLKPGSTGGPPVTSGGLPDAVGDARYGKRVPSHFERSRAGGLCSAATGQIFVGTHALLYEPEGLGNPGLVVIDEQHKFGVAQRGRLTTQDPAPDVFVMTATPIPRTLTMSLYGDLDVSTIDEMPADRGRIVTAARDEEKLPDVLAFLRRELEAGRQAYIVYPLIDESEKLEAKAASAEFEKWREWLQPFTCELLHGRIPAPEKQRIMERFRRGLTSVLVSTTVIEVGVDVANATVMLIENAERFGLAQLHQLRGRIGRGAHKSYCILLRSDPSEETIAKLAVLERTSNGFEVAEADWELRGPGDLLGTAQSGLPELKLGNLRSDAKLMQRARAAAIEIFRDDPLLAKPENQRFQRLVVEEVGKTFSHVS
jgi:ATP-dependent DNA helicase RecG